MDSLGTLSVTIASTFDHQGSPEVDADGGQVSLNPL